LQCHTAQFTWKLVFDVDRKQYEVLFSACSEAEEDVWKRNMRARISNEKMEHAEGRSAVPLPAFVHPDIRPLGCSYSTIFSFPRRLSIQRAVTMGTKASTQQVIIKNTEAQRYSNAHKGDMLNINGSTATLPVTRSQSHNSSSHIPTLAPRRSDRVKLESLLVDIWTKPAIPYPGMSGKSRSENSIRASANSVMRKLSMASIASNFSKRSASHTTTAFNLALAPGRADERPFSRSVVSMQDIKKQYVPLQHLSHKKTPSPPVLVDFHSAPEAFLPEDFEIPNQKPLRRASNLSEKLSSTISFVAAASKPGIKSENGGTITTGLRISNTMHTGDNPVVPDHSSSGSVPGERQCDVSTIGSVDPAGNLSSVVLSGVLVLPIVEQSKSRFEGDESKESNLRVAEAGFSPSSSENSSFLRQPLKRLARPRKAFFRLFG
jgi:hypothetical protein